MQERLCRVRLRRTGRAHHTAPLLPNGKVLIVVGYGSCGPLASAELFDENQ